MKMKAKSLAVLEIASVILTGAGNAFAFRCNQFKLRIVLKEEVADIEKEVPFDLYADYGSSFEGTGVAFLNNPYCGSCCKWILPH